MTSICCQTRKCSVLIAVTNNTPSILVSLWELHFHFCTKKSFRDSHQRRRTLPRLHNNWVHGSTVVRKNTLQYCWKWPFRVAAKVSAAAPSSTKDASQWETAAVRARHIPDDLTATRHAGVLRRLLTRRDLINQPC